MPIFRPSVEEDEQFSAICKISKNGAQKLRGGPFHPPPPENFANKIIAPMPVNSDNLSVLDQRGFKEKNQNQPISIVLVLPSNRSGDRSAHSALFKSQELGNSICTKCVAADIIVAKKI